MPILGITASQVPGRLDTNSYESISTATVGAGGAATIDLTSIPGTYRHLQVRGIIRSDRETAFEGFNLRFNNNSNNNYWWHRIFADGSTVAGAAESPIGNGIAVATIPASSTASNIFGVVVIDILDYSNTNKNKTLRCLSGIDANGSGNAVLASGLYSANTNAITSIHFFGSSGQNLSRYSQLALYGIKGA